MIITPRRSLAEANSVMDHETHLRHHYRRMKEAKTSIPHSPLLPQLSHTIVSQQQSQPQSQLQSQSQQRATLVEEDTKSTQQNTTETLIDMKQHEHQHKPQTQFQTQNQTSTRRLSKLEKVAQNEIARTNQIMVKHLLEIMQKKSSYSFNQNHHPHPHNQHQHPHHNHQSLQMQPSKKLSPQKLESLNYKVKKQEQQRIMKENKILAEKLMKTRGVYAQEQSKWDEEYRLYHAHRFSNTSSHNQQQQSVQQPQSQSQSQPSTTSPANNKRKSIKLKPIIHTYRSATNHDEKEKQKSKNNSKNGSQSSRSACITQEEHAPMQHQEQTNSQEQQETHQPKILEPVEPQEENYEDDHHIDEIEEANNNDIQPTSEHQHSPDANMVGTGGPALQNKHLQYWFSSVWRSFLTNVGCILGGVNWDEVIEQLLESCGFYVGIAMSLYIVFCMIAILNFLTGVFVDRTLSDANAHRRFSMAAAVRDLFFAEGAREHITFEEFQEKLHHKDMQEYFQTLDLDIGESQALFELLDIDGCGGLSSEEMVDGCLRLSGPALAIETALIMKELVRLQGFVQKLGDELRPRRAVRTKAGQGA